MHPINADKANYLAIRRRYAACIVRYRSIAATLQASLKQIEGCLRYRRNPDASINTSGFRKIAEETVSGINNLVETFTRVLEAPYAHIDAADVEWLEKQMLFMEHQSLPLVEIAKLPNLKTKREDIPDHNREFCIDYLKFARQWLNRLESFNSSQLLSVTEHEQVALVSKRLEACITLVASEVARPVFRLSQDELLNWLGELKNIVCKSLLSNNFSLSAR